MGRAAEKRCPKCGLVKPASDYPIRSSTGGLQAYCRLCWNEYHKQRYLGRKSEFIARANERIKRVRALLRSGKEKPCVHCGIQYPYYVMQYDHREGETKLYTIANLNRYQRASMAKLLAEIAKCDVVCANCHAERTYQRRRRRAGKEAE